MEAPLLDPMDKPSTASQACGSVDLAVPIDLMHPANVIKLPFSVPPANSRVGSGFSTAAEA